MSNDIILLSLNSIQFSNIQEYVNILVYLSFQKSKGGEELDYLFYTHFIIYDNIVLSFLFSLVSSK